MHKTIQNILTENIKNVYVAGRDFILKIYIPGENPNIWTTMKAGLVNYFLVLSLDWLLFCQRREIRLGSKNLYIERPGGVGDLLRWYLILAITLVGFYYISSLIYKKMKIKSKQIGITTLVLGILVILGTIVISLSYFVPIARVDTITPITGHVPDPGSSYSYLFVRPFGSVQCWLQNPVPLQPGTDGVWRTLAHFGGIGGMGYEIMVINSVTKLDKFSRPGGFDCNYIPGDVKRFVRVVYHR